MEKKEQISGKSIESIFDKIERLSKLQRILISGGVLLLIIGAFIYLLYLPKFEKIKTLSDKLTKLEKQLQIAKKNAADLKKFQAKMQEAEAQFKIAMRALPEKEEIPSLLTAISESGKTVGLDFLLFEPRAEKRKEFYAELPVAMSVRGDYHNLAMFFDKVARLSRIVNIQNISMGRTKGGDRLNTTCTAVTYKFVEAPPKKKQSNKSKKSKKGKRNKKKKR